METVVKQEVRINQDFAMNGCNGYDMSPNAGKRSLNTKVFCDPVHGQIEFHPACVAIIDTPQFQRLRCIKQTGFLDYIFPGSTHNRFSHSLGVCYLAGKFVQELSEKQPELSISEKDILCVKIAGLCHDLGHGPYSHTWELYMKQASLKRNESLVWKHEVVSVNMFDHLIEENDLVPILESHGIGSKEFKRIKDYILGAQPDGDEKAFLNQIVNNDNSGLDVDKWDYFLRDCHYLGLKCSFEYQRLIHYAKVFVVNGKYQICYRDKVLESVHNVFRTRSTLHRLAYQHKIIILIEQMFLDAFEIADGKVIGPTGEALQFWEWSMSACFRTGDDLKEALRKYCMLTDDVVFSSLRHSVQPEVRLASDIVKATETRSFKGKGFYQHIGLKIFHTPVDKQSIASEMYELLPLAHNETLHDVPVNSEERIFNPVTREDICVVVVPISWGKGNKNPVEFVHFYSKTSVFTSNGPLSMCSDVSAMLPHNFQEIQVHVLCRRNDAYATRVTRKCFQKFCEKFQLQS